MNLHQLENDHYLIEISEEGAELQHIYSKTYQQEILWNGDAAWWPRKSPVLFPFIGNLKDQKYIHDGKEYPMNRHGFARERRFTVCKKSPSKIIFQLHSDEESLAIYPFPFRLEIIYEFKENSLNCFYRITNPSNNLMLFNIGAHPAFRCPVMPGEKWEDYTIQFKFKEPLDAIPLSAEGLVKNEPVPLFAQGLIPLRKESFENDALIFKNLKSHVLRLFSSQYTLQFNWYNFPIIACWTPKGCDQFICLEPWTGTADPEESYGELKKKPGIIRLPEKSVYNCHWTITL